MTRLIAVAALTGWVAFTIGIELGRRWADHHHGHTIEVLEAKLAAAQRDPAHRRCRRVEQALSDHADFLEDQLDDGRRVADEVEAYLRDGGGS